MDVMRRYKLTVSGRGVAFVLMQAAGDCPAISAPHEITGIVRNFLAA
jgi:hypothetical protein